MQLTHRFRSTILFAAMVATWLAPLSPAAANPAAETSWTNCEGVTIWARFAGAQGDSVLLVRAGKRYQVPLSRLSRESAAKAERLLGNRLGGALPPQVGPPDPARTAVPMPAKPAISATRVAARDRHGMPLYPFTTRRRVVRTTAYTCDEADHLIYGDKSAIGTPLRATGEVRSAAADWSVYPPGTTFSIKGLPGVYVVDDYGSALTGTGTIDIYQPNQQAMKRWGCRNVEITVIRWGSLSRGAAILRGRQGASHCREMLAAILRHRRPSQLVAAR